MPKVQKYSQTIALVSLMISLNLSPALANTEKFCKETCKKLLSPEYMACKRKRGCSEEVEFRDNECKQMCSKENPSPKYDVCKTACMAQKTHSSPRSKK